jgi:hypothetical protein
VNVPGVVKFQPATFESKWGLTMRFCAKVAPVVANNKQNTNRHAGTLMMS